MLDAHDFTFLIEDPATIWNLGPQRYPQIAARYQRADACAGQAGDRHQRRGAISGRLSHQTTNRHGIVRTGPHRVAAFPRVALYFENSILSADLALLSAAASQVDRAETVAGKLVVESRRGAGVPWQGPALVDGKPWPVLNEKILWLPRGPHSVEHSQKAAVLRMLDFNGDLKSAKATTRRPSSSPTRAAPAPWRPSNRPQEKWKSTAISKTGTCRKCSMLPRGQHLVTIAK